MESRTYMKNIDIPPKKLRMFLPKVKRMSPLAATELLFYSPNRAAHIFYKAIKSAIANAKQTLKVSDDLLQFKLFTVEEGNKLKRYTAGSRGSAKPFKKRYSHIKIILTSKTQEGERVSLPENVQKSETQEADSAVSVQKEKKVKTAPKKAAVKKSSKVETK